MKDDQLFGHKVARLLDDASGRLPYRITHKLERSRGAALARMPADGADARSTAAPEKRGTGRGAMWWRFAGTVVPVALVVGGLFTIVTLKDRQDAIETAELDAALLLDEVPIAAYADRGFGVFLTNNRQ